MSKVYVLWDYDPHDNYRYIVGIYRTEKLAEKAKRERVMEEGKSMEEGYGAEAMESKERDLEIEEHEVEGKSGQAISKALSYATQLKREMR